MIGMAAAPLITSRFKVFITGGPGENGEEFIAERVNQIAAEFDVETLRPVRTVARHSILRIEYLLQKKRPAVVEKWWSRVVDASKTLEKRNIEITFTDDENNAVKGWRLKRAWPCRMGLAPIARHYASQHLMEFIEFTYEEIEAREEHISKRKKVSRKDIKTTRPLTSKQRDAFFGRKLQSDRARELWDEVDKLDVSTPYGKAMLYSGTRNISEKYAADNGLKTLEMTPGGKWLDSQNLWKDPNVSSRDAMKIWRKLSKRYASQAEGPVKIFEGARDYRRMKGSVLRNVEMNVLKNNKAVTSIEYRLFMGP